MSRDTGSTRLHNMSAPPRTTITFRPAAARPWQPSGNDGAPGASEGSSANGLRWICRVDVINHFWPVKPGAGRDIAGSIDWQQTREPDRRALVQALALEHGTPGDDPSLVAHVRELSAEAVSDELREVGRRADPGQWGLPPIAVLIGSAHNGRRPITTDMRLAVAILARTRGTIFVRAADPISLTVMQPPFDLWALGPAPGRGRP